MKIVVLISNMKSKTCIIYRHRLIEHPLIVLENTGLCLRLLIDTPTTSSPDLGHKGVLKDRIICLKSETEVPLWKN